MNIPHEWHDGEALLPPLVGTEHDAAGRICMALQGLGLTVLGVAVVQDEWHPTQQTVHVVIQGVPMNQVEYQRIDSVMCENTDVEGRWWIDNEFWAREITQLAFQVGK